MNSSSELSDTDTSDQYSFSSEASQDELSGAEGEMEDVECLALPGQAGDSMSTGERQRVKKKKVMIPGVVYLSRVPPYMKPHKLKHLLLPYGRIGHVYLQPEDDSIRKRRVKFGGNKKKNFTEGWVEFMDKRVAKAVAMALNNFPIGGRKGNYYHDDLWNIKYLPNFRWSHLTEKIAYEQAVKQQQMRTEMSQAKRENRHYLASVDKGKAVEAIIKRKKRRGATEEEVASKFKRNFMQRKVNKSPSSKSEADDHLPSATPTSHLPSATPTSQLSDSLLKKILPG